jgi:hypothetical protein
MFIVTSLVNASPILFISVSKKVLDRRLGVNALKLTLRQNKLERLLLDKFFHANIIFLVITTRYL